MWTAARTAVQGRPLGTRLTCHTPPHLQARTDTSATSEGDDTVNEFTSVHLEPAFLIFKSWTGTTFKKRLLLKLLAANSRKSW